MSPFQLWWRNHSRGCETGFSTDGHHQWPKDYWQDLSAQQAEALLHTIWPPLLYYVATDYLQGHMASTRIPVHTLSQPPGMCCSPGIVSSITELNCVFLTVCRLSASCCNFPSMLLHLHRHLTLIIYSHYEKLILIQDIKWQNNWTIFAPVLIPDSPITFLALWLFSYSCGINGWKLVTL